MKKAKKYRVTRFSADVIKEALAKFEELLDENDRKRARRSLTTAIGDATWDYDSQEEFFADYRRIPESASFVAYGTEPLIFRAHAYGDTTTIEIGASNRAAIESVFEVFERWVPESTLPETESDDAPVRPRVFIGHGRNALWRDLKDHLHEKHGYDVVAYEIGARAGHSIRDILEKMLDESSFALLVMTAEDEMADGTRRARQNVIHEAGLFQGRLGFSRAVVLLENGAEEFSNIHGVEQIRFGAGNIKETFGDVLATLRREFEDEDA
jgi:predicted nucleotide-binding protein